MSRRIRDQFQYASRIESNAKVQRALLNMNANYRRLRQLRIHPRLAVDGCRKSEGMPLIATGADDTSAANDSPMACSSDSHAVPKTKIPLILILRQCFKPAAHETCLQQ